MHKVMNSPRFYPSSFTCWLPGPRGSSPFQHRSCSFQLFVFCLVIKMVHIITVLLLSKCFQNFARQQLAVSLVSVPKIEATKCKLKCGTLFHHFLQLTPISPSVPVCGLRVKNIGKKLCSLDDDVVFFYMKLHLLFISHELLTVFNKSNASLHHCADSHL